VGQNKYVPPQDAEVAAQFEQWDEDAKEYFAERAGIRQFDGGLDRLSAERAALEETRAYLARRTRPQ